MRWSEDSDSTGATRAAAPGMPVSPRTRRGSGGTRLSSPIRPNPLRLAQDDATPKDSATHDEPLFNPGRPLGPELLRNTRAAAALRPDRGGAARRSSAATSRGAVERRAATATDRASFGSFLFVAPVARSRTRATQLGLHIKYPLARGPQLLGEQVAAPARVRSAHATSRSAGLVTAADPLPSARLKVASTSRRRREDAAARAASPAGHRTSAIGGPASSNGRPALAPGTCARARTSWPCGGRCEGRSDPKAP